MREGAATVLCCRKQNCSGFWVNVRINFKIFKHEIWMATLYKKVADYENLHKCFIVLPKLNRCYLDEHVLKMFFKDKYSYQLCSLCFYHIKYLLRVNPHSVKWLATWLSVYLWNKSLWVWVSLQYSIVP